MIDVIKCSLNTRLIAKPREAGNGGERIFKNFLSLKRRLVGVEGLLGLAYI